MASRYDKSGEREKDDNKKKKKGGKMGEWSGDSTRCLFARSRVSDGVYLVTPNTLSVLGGSTYATHLAS